MMKKAGIVASVLVVAALPLAAIAAATEITNPLNVENLDDVITKVASAIAKLAIPVAVVMYLWAGALFLIANGRTDYISRAKQILLYTSIGLAVIFIGGGFIDLIKSILNLGSGA